MIALAWIHFLIIKKEQDRYSLTFFDQFTLE